MTDLDSKIAQARVRLSLASGECPHWDYDNDGMGLSCCEELEQAQKNLSGLVRLKKRLEPPGQRLLV